MKLILNLYDSYFLSSQDVQPVKTRPVATIRPLPAAKERDAHEQDFASPDTRGKEEFPEILGKEETVLNILNEEEEKDCTEILYSNEWKTDDIHLLESKDKRHYIGNNEEKTRESSFSLRKEEKQTEHTDERINEQKNQERVSSKDIAEKSILLNKRKNKKEEESQDNTKSVCTENTVENKSQSHSFKQKVDRKRDAKNKNEEDKQKENNKNDCRESSESKESNSLLIEKSNEYNLLSLDSLRETQHISGVPKPLKPHQNVYLESHAPKNTLKSPTDEKPRGQEREELCTSHRQKIKEVYGRRRSLKKMECQNGNCHESEGFAEDFGSDLSSHGKDASITECLDGKQMCIIKKCDNNKITEKKSNK